MGVSITVSGHVFWEMCADVPLSKNFGSSTFDISDFPRSCTDLFTWLTFLLRASKAFESRLQRGHMVVPLIIQQCVPGDLLSVLKKGTDRAARSMSPSQPLAMLTLKGESNLECCGVVHASIHIRLFIVMAYRAQCYGEMNSQTAVSRSVNTGQRIAVLQKVLQFWKLMSAISGQSEHDLFVLKHQQSYN